MGQGNNCCRKQVPYQTDQTDLDLQPSEYFGPSFASNYIIVAKFLPQSKNLDNKLNENSVRAQTTTTLNNTQKRESQDKEKVNFLEISFQKELEQNEASSSYDGSRKANKSILKSRDISCSNHGATKHVRFKQIDDKVKFTKTDNRLLGQLLKRRIM